MATHLREINLWYTKNRTTIYHIVLVCSLNCCRLSCLCLLLKLNILNQERDLAFVQRYLSTLTIYLEIFLQTITIVCSQKSCGDGKVLTRVGLTDCKHVITAIHIGCITSFLTTIHCHLGSCVFSGSFCDWAAFSESHCSTNEFVRWQENALQKTALICWLAACRWPLFISAGTKDIMLTTLTWTQYYNSSLGIAEDQCKYCCPFKTRFAVGHDAGYTVCLTDISGKERCVAGVCFAINNSLVHKIDQPVNDIIMTLQIPFASGRYKGVLSAIAPTLFSPNDISTMHSDTLPLVCQEIHGDLNARVDPDAKTFSTIGPYCVDIINSKGLLLFQLYTELNLFITITFSHQKNMSTCFYHQSKHRLEIWVLWHWKMQSSETPSNLPISK